MTDKSSDSAKGVPVITLDGPSGSGKGTVAEKLAHHLGFHLLDSGAVYRAAAILATRVNCDLSNEQELAVVLADFNADYVPDGTNGVRVKLDGVDVTHQLRTQEIAEAASKIAVLPAVRASLMDEQRRFRQSPGLIADGRDMGTRVFPDARLKVFLTASLEERARRRAKQLKEKGISTIMTNVAEELVRRDARDSSREHAPLVAASDAISVDSSAISADDVVNNILTLWYQLS